MALKTNVAIPGSLPYAADLRHAQQAPQLLRRGRALLGQGARDLALAHEGGQRGVHRLHAHAAARLERRVDLVRLALADQVAHGGRGHQDLGGDDPARPVGRGQQLLGHDALERDRQLDADLALLRGREHVDDAVDRLRGVLRMQGGEDQVAGLRRGQRGGDRLQVAHLADQDHVGVLAQGGLQGRGEAGGVGAQLALVDQALLVAMEELDGVLDRHKKCLIKPGAATASPRP